MTRARRVTLFLALLAAICVALDAAYDAAARRDPIVKVNWIFDLEGRQFDFVVLGSSRAYHTVYVPALERAIGGHGVNLGLNGAAFPEEALVLDRFLEHNDTHRILFEVDPFGLDRLWLHDQLHAYLYVPYADEPLVYDYLYEYFGVRAAAWRWVPLFQYAEFNDRIGLRSVLEVLHHPPPEFDAWGSRLSSGKMSDSAVRAIVDTTYGIDEDRVRGLERILDIANAHSARVTMFMAPQFSGAAHAVRNRAQILAFYRELARKRGITFLVFDDPDIANDRTNFTDGEHLNRDGAMKFSARLGAALQADSAASAPPPKARRP